MPVTGCATGNTTGKLTGRRGFALLVSGASLMAGSVGCGGPSTAELVEKPWLVTVYYTAVESLHDDAPVPVTGCAGRGCTGRDEPLGQYPHGFVSAVRAEGSGRVTSGSHAGKYLNWSYDIGFWLDEAPRDAHGRSLQPFRSAAADQLPDGTNLRLVECGRLDSGDPVPDGVCAALRAGQWEILDRFTPGYGGQRHIDLYIGEETEKGFTVSNPLYTSLENARFALES